MATRRMYFFIEDYCDCVLDVCESLDVKGIYQKARTGGSLPNKASNRTGSSGALYKNIDSKVNVD